MCTAIMGNAIKIFASMENSNEKEERNLRAGGTEGRGRNQYHRYFASEVL